MSSVHCPSNSFKFLLTSPWYPFAFGHESCHCRSLSWQERRPELLVGQRHLLGQLRAHGVTVVIALAAGRRRLRFDELVGLPSGTVFLNPFVTEKRKAKISS